MFFLVSILLTLSIATALPNSECELVSSKGVMFGALLWDRVKEYEHKLGKVPKVISYFEGDDPGSTPEDHLEPILNFLADTKFIKSKCPIISFSAGSPNQVNEGDDYAKSMVKLVQGLMSHNLMVLLRFDYEMNGDWFPFGNKPELSVPSFQALSKTIRASLSDDQKKFFGMIWSPNFDSNIDNYANYYPGDEHVDIAAIDLYFKDNGLPPASFVEDNFKPFYDEFCAKKNKPCGFGEIGVDDGRGASEFETKKIFIDQVYSKKFFKTFPLLKLITWFEFKKDEDGQMRSWYLALGSSKIRKYLKKKLKRAHLVYASHK